MVSALKVLARINPSLPPMSRILLIQARWHRSSIVLPSKLLKKQNATSGNTGYPGWKNGWFNGKENTLRATLSAICTASGSARRYSDCAGHGGCIKAQTNEE